jgi:hypothetical protein
MFYLCQAFKEALKSLQLTMASAQIFSSNELPTPSRSNVPTGTYKEISFEEWQS